MGGLVSLLLALYTVTIRMEEKATFFSLPVSGFADVVEVVVLWFPLVCILRCGDSSSLCME